MQLKLEHISKKFNSAEALKDISFNVEKGEFVSIIGSSGAGKTTLFRILNGSLKPDSGTITIGDAVFSDSHGGNKKAMQKKIGTVYQDFCLVEPSSCMQNVLNACLPDMPLIPSILGIFGKKRMHEAEELLCRVGLSDKLYEPAKNLSGGQKQRVAIARALMRHPDILLADEPVASLDPATGYQIIALIKDLQETEGITVLMNSHNLELATEFSDRIIGLSDGIIAYNDSPEKLNKDSLDKIYTTDLVTKK